LFVQADDVDLVTEYREAGIESVVVEVDFFGAEERSVLTGFWRNADIVLAEGVRVETGTQPTTDS